MIWVLHKYLIWTLICERYLLHWNFLSCFFFLNLFPRRNMSCLLVCIYTQVIDTVHFICDILILSRLFIVVQSLSRVRLCSRMGCSTRVSLSCTISWRLLKLMSIESVMPSNRLILCSPLPLLLLPSVVPSIRVFSSKLALYIRWRKYWSFSISPSNEYSGLISFKIDWFDLPVSKKLSK